MAPGALQIGTRERTGSSDEVNNAPNAFSVDVEDYYHVSAFARRVSPREWEHFESRVVASTHRLLRLLARRQTRATFYVLGWVAAGHPALVRDIRRDGHEIGCHSHWHRLVYEQTEHEFRDDLRQARDAIGEAAGIDVTAYRAPSFSITTRSAWALDILREEGFLVDSSIFPIRHDRYGVPNLNPSPHKNPLGREGLWEVPPSVVSWGPLRVPVAGGGYFRLFPEGLTRRWHERLARRHERPLVFYIHPWELDPDQPHLSCGLLTRVRHYRNLGLTEARLERLLDRVRFGAIGDLVGSLAERPEPNPAFLN